MEVKIDTREKLNAITVDSPILAAIMTADLEKRLLNCLTENVKNVVLILTNVGSIDNDFALWLLDMQSRFYEAKASFVTCTVATPLSKLVTDQEVLEKLIYAPTYEEASDLVLMEEIEREVKEEGE